MSTFARHGLALRLAEAQLGGPLEIEAIEEIGSHALGVTWGDGHASGIHTFSYLRSLCACPGCLPRGTGDRPNGNRSAG